MIRYLDKIVDYLKENPMKLDSHLEDGRLNSAENETEVLNVLTNNFNKISIPGIRSWYDFKIEDNKNEIFVNLKVSDLNNSAADNLSSKLGMGYALTGNKNMSNKWNEFHIQIMNEIKLGYDYYFLIINKNNFCDVFWTSLKRIETLVPNGNNLPFQCNWDKNRTFSQRSEIEATNYILNQYILSWDRKTSGYPSKLKEMLKKNKLLNKNDICS